MTAWRRFLISEHLLPATQAVLQSPSRHGPVERVCYWAGRQAGRDVVATSLFVPRAQEEALRLSTSPGSNAEFVGWLRQHHLSYVAHLHSHPPGVHGHSPGDDEWLFGKREGLLSIVVPDYARGGITPLERNAFEVCNGPDFDRLTLTQIRDCIAVIPASGGRI